MDTMLSPHTVADRARALRELGLEARRRFRLSMLGEDAICLVEGRSMEGESVGMTDNYIPVLCGDAEEGEMLPMELTRENVAWGRR
jgi:tRNA A37 methylthiotransferase MiaB